MAKKDNEEIPFSAAPGAGNSEKLKALQAAMDIFLRIQRYRVCRAAAAVRPGLYNSASSALSYALIMNAFSSWFMFFYLF